MAESYSWNDYTLDEAVEMAKELKAKVEELEDANEALRTCLEDIGSEADKALRA